MVTPQETIKKIRDIVLRHYANLTISVLGKDVFSKKELQDLKDAGVDISNKTSLLSLVYFHHFINHPPDMDAPQGLQQMEDQQSVIGLKPEGETHEFTVDNLNDGTKQLIDKLKTDVLTKIEGLIRENNSNFKMDSLQNMERSSFESDLVKESSLAKLKQKLRDFSHEANRDWERVAATEMSNAIGAASLDRIVTDNQDENLKDVYVYRIIVKDSKTCKWCKKFFLDEDGSPKLYRLTTLMANGSNYGKKRDDWKAVAGAVHPFDRCSPTIELKPGFKLLPSGDVTYIGLDKWPEYISNKLSG